MITASRTMSITDGRKKLFDITREIQKPGVVYTLTEKGRPSVAILSIDEYESLVETCIVLQEHPTIIVDAHTAIKEYREGKTVPWGKVRESMIKKGAKSKK